MYISFFNVYKLLKLKKKRRVAFMMLLFMGLFSSQMFAKDSDDVFIKAEISNKNPYIGEAVVLNYNLYSKSNDISFFKRVEEIGCEEGTAAFMSGIEIDGNGRREIVDGEQYYVFPLECYAFSADRKGSFKYKGGAFEIGVKYPVVYEDPFWGRRRVYKTEKKYLVAPDITVRTKRIPESSASDENAIAVGSYTISADIPPGNIILEQPARAIITLRGRGLLDKNILPEYQEAFTGDDVKLKSMSESRNLYYDGKSVVSELILDCEFIPLEKDAEIGSVRFRFFNPTKGKYEEAVSSPVKIKVKSITTRIETVDV